MEKVLSEAEEQFCIGVGMYKGCGKLGQDAAVAARYVKRAAELGYAPAHALLGRMHLEGAGVEKNPNIAATEYRLALKGGMDEVRGRLIEVLAYSGDLSGALAEIDGIEPDEAKWSADHLLIHALVKLERDDPEKAFASALRLVRLGDSRGFAPLACCFAFGFGVAKNRDLAAMCLGRLLQMSFWPGWSTVLYWAADRLARGDAEDIPLAAVFYFYADFIHKCEGLDKGRALLAKVAEEGDCDKFAAQLEGYLSFGTFAEIVAEEVRTSFKEARAKAGK